MPSILLVDSSELTLSVTTRLLVALKCNVLVSTTAEGALRALQSDEIDLVITETGDWVGGGGATFLPTLKQASKVPVVILGGSVGDLDTQILTAAGFAVHHKPTTKDILRTIVAVTKKILLVDEDQLAREAVTEMLQALGHPVTAVATTKEALAAFKAGGFSLVITESGEVLVDGGVEFLTALKRHNGHVPAIILGSSVSTKDEEVASMMAAGFAGVWRKTVTLSELGTIVASVIG